MKNNPENSKPEDFFQNLDIQFLIHELKDPIAVIETGARTLLEKQDKFGALSARQERTIRRVIRNTRKARDMLYSLLEVGRSEAGSFAFGTFNPVDITLAVLTDCLELKTPTIADRLHQFSNTPEIVAYLDSCGIIFRTAGEMTRIEINQDVAKYRQIIGNMVKNALHYRRERIQINMNIVEDNLCVAVIDDGPGVNPGECESIFERYSQSKDCTLTARQGHGLGLAGARTMARCLGGDIELTFEPRKGTIFQLTLPVDLTTIS